MSDDEEVARFHIERNIKIHDRKSDIYEIEHGEIFNDVEQARLHVALERAIGDVKSSASHPRALDFGCGSGNLTRHLLSLGCRVVAADVSPKFLKLVSERFAGETVETLLINGVDLYGIPDASFDLIATYSVLHHIPDYLTAVREMGRLTAPGGVIVIDHELNPGFWRGDPIYKEFVSQAARLNWRKYLVLDNYISKVRRLFSPKYSNEGDIHVWRDDHIVWEQIEDTLAKFGFDVIYVEDYLLFRSNYRPEVYKRYRSKCTDMRVTVLRRRR